MDGFIKKGGEELLECHESLKIICGNIIYLCAELLLDGGS